jgi:hypothetical protein
MWNLVSVYLEMVLVSVQYRCTVCAECTTGLKIVLDAADGAPSDEAQVEAHFGPFAGSANLNAILVHCLCQTYHWIRKRFDRRRWNS